MASHVALFVVCVSPISILGGKARPGTALDFCGAVCVIPAVTRIFSSEQDGELSPPPLQPSSLPEPHENMQKSPLCLLPLLCLIIQTEKKKKKNGSYL